MAHGSKQETLDQPGSSKLCERSKRDVSVDCLSDFMLLAQSCSVSKTYERHGGLNLSKHSVQELFNPCKEAFINIPPVRPAVMHFMGILTHEGVCGYMFNLENPRNAMDMTSVDEALSKFLTLLRQSIVSNPNFFCPKVFKWTVDLLAEVSERNEKRTESSGKSLAECIQLYARHCSATSHICALCILCVDYLLNHNPNECISVLIECARISGSSFDWILSYIGSSFPSTIIGLLMKAGIENFAAHMDEMTPGMYSTNRTPAQAQILRDAYQAKLRSLGEILSQMARQRSLELKEEIKSIVREGGLEHANRCAFVRVAFLFFLSSISKDMLMITLNDAAHLVNPRSLISIASGLSKLPLQSILGVQKLPEIVLQMLLTPDQKFVTKAFDLLRILAFQDPPRNVSDPAVCVALKFHANHILGVFLSNISRQVHGQPNFRHSDLPLLNQTDDQLVKYIWDLKAENEAQKCYSFRLLVYLALARGEDKACEVMALLFFSATQDSQLAQFISMNRVLRPFYPRILHQLIERFEAYKIVALQAIKPDFDNVGLNWVTSFIFLLQFQLGNENASTAGQINLHPDEPKLFFELIQPIQYNYGDFVMSLLSLCCVKDTEVTRNVLQLLRLVGRPVHLIPKYVMQIIHGSLEIFFELLQISHSDVGKELVKDCSDFCIAFTLCQHEFARHTFWKALGENMFRHHWTLLCDPPGPSANWGNGGGSLLEGNLSRVNGGASDMIHSGSIRKVARSRDVGLRPPLIARTLVLLDFLDSCCHKETGATFFSPKNLDLPNEIVYDLDSCRMLANVFTQLICDNDAIASLFQWEEWTNAKLSPAIEKYLTISKKVDDLKFGWDILFLIAEVNPCLWFCSPVLKSLLASCLAQCQSSVNRQASVNKIILCKLDKWFCLLVTAHILPQPLDYLYDVICAVPNLEASVILQAIWNYLKSIHPTKSFLRSHFEMCNLQVDDVPPLKADTTFCLDECQCVLQAHIDKVGYLFPKLYPSALQ